MSKLAAYLAFAAFFASGIVAWSSLLALAWTYLPTWASVAVSVPAVAIFALACVVGGRLLAERE